MSGEIFVTSGGMSGETPGSILDEISEATPGEI